MYCRKCGVEVPNNEEICEACRMEQIIIETNAPRVDMSHEGRGAAVTSVVLSVVGIILQCIMTSMIAFGSIGAGAFFEIVTLSCLIVSLILGIRGISAFRSTAGMNAERPVASLVCGIIGVATTGIVMFCHLIVVITFVQLL